MKNIFKTLFVTTALLFGATSCGNDFLDTDINSSVELEDGLNSVEKIGVALNGAYNCVYNYYFCGNYAVSIGDIAADLTQCNFSTGHFSSIYTWGVTDTDSYLLGIWAYGYKVIDNSTRIINAGEALLNEVSEGEKADLQLYIAEAYGLRALAYLYMSNVFALPYKVDNGTDNGSQLGLAIVNTPVGVNDKVQRSTIAQTYEEIFSNLRTAISLFETVGGDRGMEYISLASAQALYARASLYAQNYEDAAKYAQLAIDNSGTGVITNAAEYKAQYAALAVAGNETIFNIHVDAQNNLSANSPGTLWTTYGIMPSPEYGKLLGDNDIRSFLMDRDPSSTDETSLGGKYLGVNGNPANSSQRLIGAPEMYLIIAEAKLKGSGDINGAKAALFNVAARNNDITSADALPSSKSELISFVEDERARELIQEGHRFQDCRRWGKSINVYYVNEALGYRYHNFDVSKFVYPIPDSELSSDAGIEQNPNWSSNLPK